MQERGRFSYSALLNSTFFSLILLYILAFLGEFFRFKYSLAYDGAPLGALSEGTAHKPYQLRFLVPWLVRVFHGLGIGSVLISVLNLFLDQQELIALGKRFYCHPEKLVIYFILDILLLLSSLTFFFKLCKENLRIKTHISFILTLALIVVLFHNFLSQPDGRYFYSYDIASLFFLVLGLYLSYKNKPILFIAVFLVGCFNKETIIFNLIPFYYLYGKYSAENQFSPKVRNVVLFLLAVSWLLLRGVITNSFINNGGFPFHPNLLTNIGYLFNPTKIPTILVSSLGLLVLSLIGCFKGKGNFHKSLVLTFLVYMLCFMTFGKLIEYRAYTEFIPLMVLLSGNLIFKYSYNASGKQSSC